MQGCCNSTVCLLSSDDHSTRFLAGLPRSRPSQGKPTPQPQQKRPLSFEPRGPATTYPKHMQTPAPPGANASSQKSEPPPEIEPPKQEVLTFYVPPKKNQPAEEAKIITQVNDVLLLITFSLKPVYN